MLDSPRCLLAVLILAVPIGLAVASPATAQQIRGRVVDEPRRAGLAEATVTVIDSAGATVSRVGSDARGFFLVDIPRPARYDVVVELIGYAAQRRSLALLDEDITLPAFVLVPAAIPLEPVEARAASVSPDPVRATGMQRTYHIVAGERLANLEDHGGTFLMAVSEFAAVRIWQYVERSGRHRTCLESRRRMDRLAPREPGGDICEWIAIVVDGMIIADPEETFRSLHLAEYESIEYLPPVEAGFRYGLEAASVGAIVLWSRGRGPHAAAGRDR
jgi:hypothetical protein